MKNTLSPRIHIIDKSPAYRKVVEGLVQALGFSHITSTTCCEQLLTVKIKPDIIIIDHDLGEHNITGLEFLYQYGTTHFPDSRFVFLTSTDDLDIAMSSIRAGAVDYILKSKSGLDRLVRKLEILVRSYKIRHLQKRNLRIAAILLGFFGFLLILAVLKYYRFS